VLDNEDFVKFANESIICVVGHNDPNHPTETEDEKGKKTPGCPLYPGLTCEEHRAINQQVSNPPTGCPKIELPNGVPNSWLVAPDGTVEQIPSADQQSAGKVQELAEALQKKAGKSIGWKDYSKISEAFEAGAKAIEESDFKAALSAYAQIDKKAAKMPASVGERLTKQVEALNAKIAEAFEALKAVEDPVQRDKDVKALKSKVMTKLSGKALPVLADIDAWLKANPLPPK
jgi:hypothetical protein